MRAGAVTLLHRPSLALVVDALVVFAALSYLYRQLRGEMYWFRLLFLLTSFGFACSSVLPTSSVLRLLLTGVFFAFDALIVSVWAPFEQWYRNALSAATSAFGVVQCEVLLVLVQLGVDSPSSGGNVNLGYSQRGVAQSEDPSSALTGQTDFASWCAIYLALAIAFDVIVIAAVYRHTVWATCRRAGHVVASWALWLAATIEPALATLRLRLSRRATTAVERADPQRYRRESVVDVIKSRLLLIRSHGVRRASQPPVVAREHPDGAGSGTSGGSNPQLDAKSEHSATAKQPTGVARTEQPPSAATESREPSLRVARADTADGNCDDQQESESRLQQRAGVGEQSTVSDQADGFDTHWRDESLVDATSTLVPTVNRLTAQIAVEPAAGGGETGSTTLPATSNFRLIRLPVIVNARLPVLQSTSPLSSSPRTPTTPRSIWRQARLSRRRLSLSPTGRLHSKRTLTALSSASDVLGLHTPTQQD